MDYEDNDGDDDDDDDDDEYWVNQIIKLYLPKIEPKLTKQAIKCNKTSSFSFFKVSITGYSLELTNSMVVPYLNTFYLTRVASNQ